MSVLQFIPGWVLALPMLVLLAACSPTDKPAEADPADKANSRGAAETQAASPGDETLWVRQDTFPKVQRYLTGGTDSLTVVNFWATWCKPCVAEMPHFLELAQELQNRPVKWVFISLDFPDQYQSRVIPFLEKRNFPHEVINLTDTDPNNWIDQVNPSWEGDIPATLLLDPQGEELAFQANTFSKQDLHAWLKPHLQNLP